MASPGRWIVPLFALTLFWGAALIFTVEPMFGKMALPPLGGAPAVWNTCMVFYQAALLAGYAYAHLLARAFATRTQAIVHVILLAAAAVALPPAIPAGSAPPSYDSPVPWLLLTLVRSLGGPLVVLSATAPLLQKWFAGTRHPAARDPYFLYAASNAGSMAALAAYPVALEPWLPLSGQSVVWSAGYALLVALSVACGVWAVRLRRVSTAAGDDADPAPVAEGAVPAGWRRRGRWLALALVPSSLMLSVTTYISTDVAAVPLLWVVPLALYLLSFILSFARSRFIPPALVRSGMVWLAFPIIVAVVMQTNRPAWLLVLLHLSVLFVFALALHTELADDRPATERLTEFYLWIAAGGVAGGLFNTLAAPLLFSSVLEYPIALAAALLLRPLWPARGQRVPRPGWIFPVAAGVLMAVFVAAFQQRAGLTRAWLAPTGGALLFTYVMCTSRSQWFAAAAAAMVAAGIAARSPRGDVLLAERTFFGVYRVTDLASEGQRHILHGTTLHGGQLTNPARAGEPIFYYHQGGPIGQLFGALDDRLTGGRVGVIGLGAGGLAAYAREGQQWTFFELDPMVERIARDARLFTYLERCGETCHVIVGDARLSLAREPRATYDLLIVDAFSSDAIPVHLLTREALALYLDVLDADGVLALHISNRHLDLGPLVASLAAEQRLAGRIQRFRGSPADPTQTSSQWVVLSHAPGALGSVASDLRWEALTAPGRPQVWTDDFSNLVGLLKALGER